MIVKKIILKALPLIFKDLNNKMVERKIDPTIKITKIHYSKALQTKQNLLVPYWKSIFRYE